MSTTRSNGVMTPAQAHGSANAGPSQPKRKFPAEALRPHMRSVLASTLAGVQWDPTDKARMSSVSKQIADKVKLKMLELVPRGFKYIVTVTLSENLGQAGRADMTCHWEDTDAAIQEMYSNESIIFVCVAFAIRVI